MRAAERQRGREDEKRGDPHYIKMRDPERVALQLCRAALSGPPAEGGVMGKKDKGNREAKKPKQNKPKK